MCSAQAQKAGLGLLLRGMQWVTLAVLRAAAPVLLEVHGAVGREEIINSHLSAQYNWNPTLKKPVPSGRVSLRVGRAPPCASPKLSSCLIVILS